MTAQSDALLAALRDRAVKRNAVRDEMREQTKKGDAVLVEQMPSWVAFQRAETAVRDALIAWEASEGIDDGTAEIMKPREMAGE